MYQLDLYRHATRIGRFEFVRVQTAKKVASDNLNEFAANVAIITYPRGKRLSKVLGRGSTWHFIETAAA